MSTKISARPEQDDQSSEPLFPRVHPLLQDGWRFDDEPEFGRVHSAFIADVTRAGNSVRTIAHIVHNSLDEPGGSGSQPLGKHVEISLCEAMICLGEYIFEKTELMREVSRRHWEYERREQETANV